MSSSAFFLGCKVFGVKSQYQNSSYRLPITDQLIRYSKARWSG